MAGVKRLSTKYTKNKGKIANTRILQFHYKMQMVSSHTLIILKLQKDFLYLD